MPQSFAVTSSYGLTSPGPANSRTTSFSLANSRCARVPGRDIVRLISRPRFWEKSCAVAALSFEEMTMWSMWVAPAPMVLVAAFDGRGELDEDAVARFWVEEADHAGEAGARLLVDQLDAFGARALQLFFHVVGFEANVMHALAAGFEEACDSCVFASGFQQLDLGRYYQKGDEPGQPSGPPLHIDWGAVYPTLMNPSVDDYPAGSELNAAAREFNESYAGFLAFITRAYTGQPDLLLEAVWRMFRIRDDMNRLIRNPLPGRPGVNAAPTFEVSDLMGGAGA